MPRTTAAGTRLPLAEHGVATVSKRRRNYVRSAVARASGDERVEDAPGRVLRLRGVASPTREVVRARPMSPSQRTERRGRECPAAQRLGHGAEVTSPTRHPRLGQGPYRGALCRSGNRFPSIQRTWRTRQIGTG